MFQTVTCGTPRLSDFGWPVMLRGPGGQSIHLLETAALFTPHMVDLHGCFTLCYKVQILLSQVGPELPDFKLMKEEEMTGKEITIYNNLIFTVFVFNELKQ